MKIFIGIAITLLLFLTNSFAQVNSKHIRVNGYYRKDGTYVEPYYRTAPNSTNQDNFSTQGNINPYTGKEGWIPSDNHVGNNKSRYNNLHSSYNTNYNTGKSNETCKTGLCKNQIVFKYISLTKIPTSFCEKHTPTCENPSCNENSKIDYKGNYQKYCDAHFGTCQADNCANIAVQECIKGTLYTRFTDYCKEHTPLCKMINCNNNVITANGLFLEYCINHQYGR